MSAAVADRLLPRSPRLLACCKFTKVLIDMYMMLRDRSVAVEVVYCSRDAVYCEYTRAASRMPWWCLPFDSKEALFRLVEEHHAEGIPHLVVIDQNEVIRDDAVQDVLSDPCGWQFPWKPRRVKDDLPANYISGTKQVPMSNLTDRYLMLYFTASWSQPCRSFLPKLIRASQCLRDKPVEFLLVSADEDNDAYESLLARVPFGALPYSKEGPLLASTLGVRSMPSLVLLGPEANGDRITMNRNMRNVIEEGLSLEGFPSFPMNFGDLRTATEGIHESKCVVALFEERPEGVKQAIQCASSSYSQLHFYWALEPCPVSEALRDTLHVEGPRLILLDLQRNGSYYLAPPELSLSCESILHFIDEPGVRQRLQ